jgi:HK97 family phage portal protein
MGILDAFFGRRSAASASSTPDGIVTMGIDDTLMPGHVSGGVYKQSAPPPRGSYELLDLFKNSPWLRATTHKIASSFASIEWKVYARQARAADGTTKFVDDKVLRAAPPSLRPAMIRKARASGDLVLLDEHPLQVLLDKPNPLMSGRAFRQVCQVHLDLLGETYIVLDTNPAGMPVRMWPIPPTWIKQIPTETQPSFRVEVDGVSFDVPVENMLVIRDQNPADPYGRGVGTGLALADELDIDEFAAKHVATWFHNKGMPDMLISLEGASRPLLEEAKRRWDNATRGFAKAYRTHWTGAKLDVKRLDTAFKDMALIEIRSFERNTIVQVFGVPPEKLGIIENSNRSTSESAQFIFANDVLVPRAELWRSELQNKLVDRFDARLVLDYESPVPGDREFKKNVMQAFSEMFTIDEIRALAEMDPLPDGKGNAFMVTSGKSYSTDLSKPATIPIYGYHLSAGVLTNDEVRTSLGLPPASDSWGGDRAVGMYLDPNMMLAAPTEQSTLPLEVQASNTAAIVRAREARRALVRRSLSKAQIDALVESVDVRALGSRIEPLVRSLVEAWGNDTLKSVESATTGFDRKPFDVNDPNVKAHLREYVTDRLGRLINTTTKAELKTALEAAAETDADPAEAVRSVFTRAEIERSDVIAETEVRRSSQFATKEALTQSGIVMQNEWLSTMDGRARDEHRAMDEQRRDLTKPFEVTIGEYTGARAMYPGGFGIGALDINCRCAIAPVIIESEDNVVPASLRESIAKNGEIVISTMSADERERVWRALDRKAQAWDARYSKALSSGFREQERAVLDALAKV